MKTLFEQGLELEKQGDFENALKLYAQAADHGASDAQWRLGLMYHLGKGVEKNLEQAVHWYQKSAKQGNAEGQWHLGCMYQEGCGVTKDLQQAAMWLELSANQNSTEAQFILANLYQYELYDFKKAFKWFESLAKSGYQEGISNLIWFYIKGIGIEKNHGKALELLQRLDQNDLEYFEIMGIIFHEEHNFEKSIEYYQYAIEKGSAIANVFLADMYIYGKGCDRNIQKAAEYLKAAIAQQDELADGFALVTLGLLYEFGNGVEKNYDLAKIYYQQAIQRKSTTAALQLANMYESGRGVDLDIQKALEYWHIAADFVYAPEAEATYKIGYSYYDGYGVERNLEKAKEYFERAIKQGYHCSYALNMVKGELGELNDSNKMREYADGLIKKHIPNTKLYQQISKDLQNDFGDTWNITCRETKKFLETGMFTYFSLYSLGPHIYGNMDFSASITPMFKALEKELGKYLYFGYIEFLKKKEVSPNTFPQKRSHIKRIGQTELAYRDPSDLTEFTLGNLHLTVGLERKPQFAENDTFKYVIDQQMTDYLNSIFKEDTFGEAMREREITDYIISLTQEVKSIADSLRNPAAHDQAMKIHKAEVCGNYIIKVQRLLIDFLEKIKFPQNEKDKK